MATSLPSTVKTVLQVDIQKDDLILTTLPIPVPAHPDDHLIKVHATAPTLGELTWARYNTSLFPADRLNVPGPDMAGVVVKAPENSPFKPGDRVFALQDFSRPGALREYTLTRTRELAHMPRTFSFTDAVALPMSALTAYQALFVHGTLDAAALDGDDAAREKNSKIRVLITAAGGGVGSAALQLASAAGVTSLTAVASGSKRALVESLGATHLVDYTSQTLGDWARSSPGNRADLILDCIGGSSLVDSWSIISEGGTFLSICAPPDTVRPQEGSTAEVAKSEFFIVERYGSDLEKISRWADQGKIKAIVDSVVPFEEFQKAFDKVNGRHAQGKVVIKIVA